MRCSHALAQFEAVPRSSSRSPCSAAAISPDQLPVSFNSTPPTHIVVSYLGTYELTARAASSATLHGSSGLLGGVSTWNPTETSTAPPAVSIATSQDSRFVSVVSRYENDSRPSSSTGKTSSLRSFVRTSSKVRVVAKIDTEYSEPRQPHTFQPGCFTPRMSRSSVAGSTPRAPTTSPGMSSHGLKTGSPAAVPSASASPDTVPDPHPASSRPAPISPITAVTRIRTSPPRSRPLHLKQTQVRSLWFPSIARFLTIRRSSSPERR